MLATLAVCCCGCRAAGFGRVAPAAGANQGQETAGPGISRFSPVAAGKPATRPLSEHARVSWQNEIVPSPDRNGVPPVDGMLPKAIAAPADTGRLDSPSGLIAPPAAGAGLALDVVLRSVEECYPEIDIALAEIETANGKVLSSWGNFDSQFGAYSISQPLGFYQNYRNGAVITQPLFGGGEVFGSWHLGDGNFEPWFGERETNEGGEFKAGLSVPLLKDRTIDARRAAVRTARANRDEVEADVESRLLQFQLFATQAYWDWVASGRAVQVQQRLLELAEQRVDQIRERVDKGDLAQIARIDNDRFIAKRQNDLIKARRLFEKAAIKLSLFFRDSGCNPVIAPDAWLPAELPGSSPISDEQRESDAATAIAVRPELIELNAARRAACVDLQYANNLLLPKLDVKGYAAKDVGEPTSSLGDKTPFQLNVGLYAEVPLQRREALGKIQAARGKLGQIDAKLRFVTDKIRAEIQDAASAVNAASDQIRQSQLNVELTRRSRELGQLSFEAGDIDLIALNIYESAVADAELELLEAQFKYFFYLAAYEVAKTGLAFQ
jgi:outer membrane protein TolC